MKYGVIFLIMGILLFFDAFDTMDFLFWRTGDYTFNIFEIVVAMILIPFGVKYFNHNFK